jgi:hypothetical protein
MRSRGKGIAGWEVGIEGEGGLEDLICTDPANLGAATALAGCCFGRPWGVVFGAEAKPGAAFFQGEIFWREMAFFLLKPKLWPGKCGGAFIFWY